MLNNTVAQGWSHPATPLLDQRRFFSAALECFDTGIALLGDGFELVHANGAMRALEPLGAFRIGPRSLTFVERRTSDAFDDVLATIRTNDGAFVARDAAGNPALFVRILVAQGSCSPSGGPFGAIVLATNPNRRTIGDRRLFQIALGLSRAEAGVAATLLEGLDVKEVAARLHVSHETVRTHLKRIFEKTRTRRQAELLLVLMQIARIGPPPGAALDTAS